MVWMVSSAPCSASWRSRGTASEEAPSSSELRPTRSWVDRVIAIAETMKSFARRSLHGRVRGRSSSRETRRW